ncbi:MAG: PAS domain S-box protein [Desulfuromonadaceae bacterium]|nr:PAS domain S-box protein [Desulfuromonadaceae bacterium]
MMSEVRSQHQRDHRLLHATTLLAEAESSLWRLQYALPQFMLSDETNQARILAEDRQLFKQVEQSLQAFEDTAADEEELRLSTQVQSAYVRYRDARPRFFELWQQGNRDAAIAWKTLAVTPFGLQTLGIFDQLIQQQRNNAQAHFKITEQQVRNQFSLLGLAMLVVIAALLSFLWATVALLKPLRTLDEEARRIIRDECAEEVTTTTTRNELALLSQNIRQMSERLLVKNEKLEHAHANISAQKRIADELNRMLQTVLDTIPVRIFWKDHNLRYLGCNQLFADDAGVTSSLELIGKDDFDLSWHESAKLYRHDDLLVLTSGQPKLNYREPQTHKNGSTTWLRTAKVPLRDEAEHIFGVLGVYEDITDQIQAEIDLRNSEARFSALFKGAQDGILLSETKTARIIDANPRICTMLGYSYDELTHLSIPDIHLPDDLPRITDDFERQNCGESITVPTLDVVRKDGSTFPADISVSLLDIKGQRYVAGFFRDVSDRLRSEEEIRANLAKREFLATMSHEIRTPLNAIINGTYLLEQTTVSKDQQETLEMISVSSKNLLALINDSLDFAKIESGEMQIDPHPFSLEELLHDLRIQFTPLCQRKNLALSVAGPSKELAFALIGDGNRVRQMLVNLLSNAIKFTAEGRISVEVQTVTQDQANQTIQLKFIVSDSGIGMTQEVVNKLFTPFTQADMSTSRRYGGTGLGLSIVKQLSELMGGSVGVTSTPGAGSSFWIELPFTTAAKRTGKSARAKPTAARSRGCAFWQLMTAKSTSRSSADCSN